MYGMGMSQHIGFTHWNEDECRMAVVVGHTIKEKIHPCGSRRHSAEHAEGSPWLDNTMKLKDFLNPDCPRASVTLYSRSDLKAEYKVLKKPGWLSVEPMEGWLDGVREESAAESYLDKTEITGNEPDLFRIRSRLQHRKENVGFTVPVYTGNLRIRKMYLWIQWGISASKRHIM